MKIAPRKKSLTRVATPKKPVSLLDIVELYNTLEEKKRAIAKYASQFDGHPRDNLTFELAELTYNEAVDELEKQRDEFYAMVDLFGEQNPAFIDILNLAGLPVLAQMAEHIAKKAKTKTEPTFNISE